MTRIQIKDENSLRNILKIISGIDNWRWKTNENYNLIHFCGNDLRNQEKILTHWMCYITDRQMPFEGIWDRGGYIFSELVHEYSRNNTPTEEILSKYYQKRGEDGKKRFFRSQDLKYTFASRYVTNDYNNIMQTLQVLSQEYGKNIIEFIIDIMNRFRDEKDLLIRIACSLHLLTYNLDKGKKANSKRTIKILKDTRIFSKNLEKFKNNSTENKKRLWCCIRDYKKGGYCEIFKKAIRDVFEKDADEFIKIWEGLPMDQIELPGDIWNNSPIFRDKLLSNVIDIEQVPKQWRMPKIIREIYTTLKNDGKVDDFYPEQFDITFDFVPRMCSKKLCEVCFFGKNGVKSICIPTTDKYCPVALITCGYFIKCNDQEQKCHIKDDIGMGICKGIEKFKNT